MKLFVFAIEFGCIFSAVKSFLAGFADILRLDTDADFRGAIQSSLWLPFDDTIGKERPDSNAIFAWLIFYITA